VGKTTAAIALAEHLGGEIICADSRTIYRGMDIGTAKPTPEQRSRVPHHLLDIADPDEVITLAAYRDRAVQAIGEIRARHRVPLLTGGTGLYIRAVVDGFTIPAVPPDSSLRMRMEATERDRPGTLHERLRRVDPVAAGRIHPRNVRRLVRALEVSVHTGRPITSQQHRDPIGAVNQIGLTVDRTELYRRIDSRVDTQLAAGLVDEVQGLLARGYALTLPAMHGLGYKEIAEYLQGRVPLAEAVRRLKRNTRRYAKRQFTWFRRDDRIQWLDVEHQTPEQVADSIIRMVESH
jgi:tRNA dimethylallyltransferase